MASVFSRFRESKPGKRSMKDRKDEGIQRKFAQGLKDALDKNRKTPEEAAALLEVEPGTMYKYLAGNMIPGGQVLWRACLRLGTVLDKKGFRVGRVKPQAPLVQVQESAQLAFAFINESVKGERIRAEVRKKNEYVQVSLRIKIAG